METIFLLLIISVILNLFLLSHPPKVESKYTNPYPTESEMNELDIIKQKSEDEKVYRNYHSQRTQEMYEAHTEDFFTTIKAIDMYHALLQRPKEEEYEAIDKAYKKYQYECNKLKLSPHVLTYEQFAIQQSNWIFCRTIKIANPMAIFYTIYDADTAKYKDGDVSENLEAEFQTKFYANLESI